tara:strand:+ start:1168 stop:2259 length:1092 start_codon:yes stop_codon:yes gene_type:complete
MKKLFFIFLIIFGNDLFSQNYYVYVAAESDDAVSLIKFDGEISEEIDRIDVGIMPTEIEGPHGITIDPNGKYWYLSLAHGNPFGSLVKYSTETNQPITSTKLGLFPASMQISPITGLLYCVNFNLHGDMKPSTVSVVDPESMTEITQVKTGSMPHGSRISNDGLFQYSVAMMSGELFEIDAISLKVSRVLDLESKMDNNDHMMHHSMHKKENMTMKHSKTKPTWVIPHPIKNLLYIAGNGSDEIIEIDIDSWKILDRFKTGKGPYNVEITPDGKLLLATLKGEGRTGIWSLEDKSLIKVIDNSTNVSHGIAISTDSKYAFVSVEGIGGEPGKVDIIDLKKLELVSSLNVGKQAGGIAFWKISD